jgi:L-cysteine S-thiosulfotransferase
MATRTRGRHTLLGRLALVTFLSASQNAASQTANYEVVRDGIPKPLTAAPASVERGKAIVSDRRVGMCMLCHTAPFANDPVKDQPQGNIATNLAGTGSRWSEAQLRLRIVDSRRLDERSLMPSYHVVADEAMQLQQRIGQAWRNKPIFDAQQVEDVVAFLRTLK